MKHQAVLDQVVNKAKDDENTLGILLFGSVAAGTHTRESDIDLLVVYRDHKPASGIRNRRVRGIKVGTVYFTFDTLVHSQETVPYLLHVFCDAKLLFDRENTIAPVMAKIRQYFVDNPEVEAEWSRIYERFTEEKKKSKCEQTSIVQVWNELEDRYSGGERKRKFFKFVPGEGKMKNRTKSFLRQVVMGLLALVAVLAVITGGVYVWAWSATDTSLAARGIMWGDADADDWQRFPSRLVRASSEPVSFESATPDWIAEFTIDDMPLATYLEQTNTTAFIMLHGDVLLYEGYFNGSSREATQASLSVAKSFASTLVGIAIDEGYVGSLDDPITAYIPELAERDPRFAAITIRHLLTMSSGMRFDADESNPFSDDFVTYYSPDLRAAALESQIEQAPGLQFQYNDYNPLLIGMVLERATGMPVSEYLETRLWQPMGAEGDGSWDLDSERSGFERMSVGVNGRAIDFAKLGWLFLNAGRNGDRQVVPAAWVEEATRADSTTDPAAHYQYLWWVDEEHDAYYAEGNFCQFIYVYPAADLVLVRHGYECGGTYWTGLLGDIAQAIEGELE